ncbi:MAG: hypothetical protein J2P24_07790 [Streptosporangiales bacterium]|nr:hypothetical protein [Streptosporangiales bacterium]MBO0889672.1 hypothetical protein [Acidothermales bacterium]
MAGVTFEQVPTGHAGEFLARVQTNAAGTPYRVRPTRTGFEVLRDEDVVACRVQVADEAARSYAVTYRPPEDVAAGRLVATAAQQLGWRERHGTGVRFGLVVALAGGGALLVMAALVVVLLVRLL